MLIKPVADRTKGFSELQTFDPQQAIARAKGSVWELLCFGPHDVELLSTAVRRLEPLGLRLLHAAHSHAEKSPASVRDEVSSAVVLQQQCSRFFVERRGEEPDATRTEEQTSAFTEKVVQVLMATYNPTRTPNPNPNPNPNPDPDPDPDPDQVLMATYKSEDKTKFTVRPLDPKSLEEMVSSTSEMNTNLVPGLIADIDVLGLVPPSPDFNEFRRGLPMGLKHIPERPPGIPEGGGIFGNLADSSLAADILSRGPKPSARVQELEARMADLLALDTRVNRLEELELRAMRGGGAKSPEAGASGKSPIVSSPVSPKLDMMPPKTFLGASPKMGPTAGPSLSSLGLPVALNAGSKSASPPMARKERTSGPREVEAVKVEFQGD